MIKKMTKYSFVIFHKDVEDFLNGLQELGLVDITRKSRPIDDTSRELFEKIAKCKTLIRDLNIVKKEAQKENITADEQITQETVQFSDDGTTVEYDSIADEAAIEYVSIAFEEKKQLAAQLATAKGQVIEAAPWGNFSPEDLTKIRDLGYTPHFYSVSEKKFDASLAGKYPMQVLNHDRDKVYFVLLAAKGEEIKLSTPEAKFPETSVNLAKEAIERFNKDIERNKKILIDMTSKIPVLERAQKTLEEKADLYLAGESSKKALEDTLQVFEGFAPTEDDKKLEEYFNNNSEGVYFLKAKATVEDNPPIALKNNWFNRLFEPISGMYMPPNYGEHDLTPYFAIFYMLFFGFCLGDMGYGLVILLTGIFVTLKTKGMMKSIGKLVICLGIGSIIMPAVNGVVFGLSLKDFSFIKGTAYGNFLFDDMQMFWFAIIFGLVQIVFARILSAIFTIKEKGIVPALPIIGWILLIIWCAIAYANSVSHFGVPSWFKWIGIAGAVLIFFFTSNSKNPLARFGSGLYAFYDITGVFGDTLSYIRLFGLGTSGGCLGFVVNSVGAQIGTVPYAGPVIAAIFLIACHTFVLLLCCLGAFVHPMRLTFVEFYKNVGFEGGGREYKPLAKINK